MEKFETIFRYLTNKTGRTQKEIALDLKISQSKLSCYLNGRGEPSYDFLIKIADYFNVSIDYLLGHEMHTHSEKVQTVENLKESNNQLKTELQVLKNKLNQIIDIATLK